MKGGSSATFSTNAPLILAQAPFLVRAAAKPLQGYGSARRFFDLNRSQVERRLQFAMSITASPAQENVAFLKTGFFTRKILRNAFHRDAKVDDA